MKKLIVGVDIGGTFTDIVGVDDTGVFHLEKVSSTPTDQSLGLIKGINNLTKKFGLDNSVIKTVAHGTTVATNTLLEHAGAVTALITTKGFRDVLYIGRQNRPSLYSLRIQKPEVLIPRSLRREVSERTFHTGEIHVELNENELIELVQDLVTIGVESIAICFLHSYINPSNEIKALQIIRERFPSLKATISSQILPEFREYERTITTVINAYVQPKMEKYVMHLRDRLNSANIRAPLLIMKSSGGMMTDGTASSNCVFTLLSGPAGGVLGAENFAKISSHKNLITCDMGGTSFDVSVIINGKSGFRNEGEIEGYPIRFPHIDIATIGAGGGSIAWIDGGGALRVGPKSAGANPGPVSYSRGGIEPTITDANLILGYIGERLAGGSVLLDLNMARNAVREQLCTKLHKNIEEAALGILQVANASMIRAIRKITIEKGIDPRGFAILAYGGAGPLHAVEIARSLNIKNVIVPIAPGNYSALGLLVAPIRYDEVVTMVVEQKELCIDEINNNLSILYEKAVKEIERDNFKHENAEYSFSADLRYLNQDYTINIPLETSKLNETHLNAAISSFHTKHLQEYGFNKHGDPVELVNLRLSVVLLENSINFRKSELILEESEVNTNKTSRAFFNGNWENINVINRMTLKPGMKIVGPARIEELGSTTLLGPMDSLVVENDYSLLIDVNPRLIELENQ
jgi:N-methylhydantoinase A